MFTPGSAATPPITIYGFAAAAEIPPPCVIIGVEQRLDDMTAGDELARAHDSWLTVHGRWLDALQGQSPMAHLRGDPRITAASADLVETLVTRPDDVDAALARFGAELGADGWHLERITSWVKLLVDLLPRHTRRRLAGYSPSAALAEGWAKEFVRGSGRCVDPVTGLATSAVLRVRLGEVYDECRSLETAASTMYTLVVADILPDHSMPDPDRFGGSFSHDAAMARAAHVALSVFDSGETIVRHGDRLLVLATHTERTASRVKMLSENLADERVLAVVWHDELPSDTNHVDRYFDELTVTV
jgi:hypothetical protein